MGEPTNEKKGRRIEVERRQFSYFIHIPERRFGPERRSGVEEAKKPIPTILVDGSAEFRNTLRSVLEQHRDIEVIAEAEDTVAIRDIVKEGVVTVIVLNIDMYEIKGILNIKRIKNIGPEVQVIVLSFQADIRYLQACFRAGASGYILSENAFDELPDAIRKVANGKIYICKDLTS